MRSTANTLPNQGPSCRPSGLCHALVPLLGLMLMINSSTARAVNYERGRLLYENQCQACHTRMLHTPDSRKIKNLTELQYRVSAWGIHAGEDWGPEEVNDVTLYLDRSFYHFGEYIR